MWFFFYPEISAVCFPLPTGGAVEENSLSPPPCGLEAADG